MNNSNLSNSYRDYIACLNRQDWANLGQYVHEQVEYNGVAAGLSGYRAMLQSNFADIPDLQFKVSLLVSDSTAVASRLQFDCSPTGKFLGLNVNGRKVSFTENVFYEFFEAKIWKVWSVVDKAAIEAQL